MIEKLTTNYSKVVMLICDNVVKFDNKNLMPLTQREIAKKLEITNQTVNSIFKELKEDSLIEHLDRKYYVTNKAMILAKKLKGLKED